MRRFEKRRAGPKYTSRADRISLGAVASMSVLKRAFVASIIALAAVPSAGVAHPRHKPRPVGSKHRRVKLPADYAAWSRVAVCESGGWRILGAAYPDALGITAANYRQFGGRLFKLGPVPLQQRVLEIRVADRLIHHYHIPIPDQDGCDGSW